MSDYTFLSQPYNQSSWTQYLHQHLSFEQHIVPLPIANNDVEKLEQLGQINIGDGQKIGVYVATIKPDTHLARNRVGLRNIVLRQVKQQAGDGALAVYVDKNSQQWRLSFMAITPKFDAEGNLILEETTSKRYTYLLGKGAQTRTAQTRLQELGKNATQQQFTAAFAVEPLTKEFYKKLYGWYERAQTQVTFPNDDHAGDHTKTALIRLLTRLLFIWFIKQKGLVNASLFNRAECQKIIKWNKPSSYYKAILQNLFFATLNREIQDRSFRSRTQGKANGTNYLVGNIYRYEDYFTASEQQAIIALFQQTPFLNGGLFECLDRDATTAELTAYDNNNSLRHEKHAIRIDGFSDRHDNCLNVPNELFFNDDEKALGLINILEQYQFTAEESTPGDADVALDPELLGEVFENLLASYNPETQEQARNATGSFYTPREIVSYMGDEALKAYLLQAGLPAEKITALLNDSEDNPLSEPEIKQAIQAIDAIKILDPAVGSGAFPMGLLQKLVAVLQKIDPENKYYKAQQIEKAETIPDSPSRSEVIKSINKVFSPENQYNNYGKKLYLIENCLYGVDLQVIAITIAKLRFFISLAIEQTPNTNPKRNYGITPLPNLETKLITADSLTPLGEIQVDIFNGEIDNLHKQLANIRRRYFTAKTSTTKRKYKQQDQEARKQMLEKSKAQGITPEAVATAQKIIDWDLYNQNTRADWFDPEWMFGIKEGFDIVIGNPPYIQLQREGGRLGRKYQPCNYQSFIRTGDIYCLFYERGVQLLKDKAHLCYITSNKWMRASYGEKLRGFFSKQNPLLLLDLGPDIFETATVDTNILLVQKAPPGDELQGVDFKLFQKDEDDLADYVQQHQTTLPKPTSDTWFIGSSTEIKLKAKIEKVGKPLKNWDIKINLGIKTGYNAAFIIDKAKRDEILANCRNAAESKRTKALIKPVLRGRDIKRYSSENVGMYLIATHNGYKQGSKKTPPIDIKKYPAIKKHLNSHWNKIKARQDQGDTPYNLRDCAYYQEFEKEKIIYNDINRRLSFSLSPGGQFINNTVYFIGSNKNINYMLAILNSNLINWYYKNISAQLGTGTVRMFSIYVNQIPIPPITKGNKNAVQQIEQLAQKILDKKQAKQNTFNEERQIDQLVYQLYGLDDAEITLIERGK